MKKIVILVLIFCTIQFIGCSKLNNNEMPSNGQQNAYENEENGNDELPDSSQSKDGINDNKGLSNEKEEISIKPVDSKYIGEGFMEGIDYDHTRRVLDETEDGYFFYDQQSSRIMFYDKNSKTSVVFCNKPNCEHNGWSEECSAFTFEFLNNYNGYLYSISDDQKRGPLNPLEKEEKLQLKKVNYYLTRVKEDGTEKENICKLFTQYLELNESGEYVSALLDHRYTIHRGYFYQAFSSQFKDESIIYIKRWNLDSDHTEEVLLSQKIDVKDRTIFGLKGYGNYIYFVELTYSTDDFEDSESKLYRLHINTGEIEEIVVGGNLIDYYISEGYLYYVLRPGNLIYKMNMETKETKLIIDNQDETYLPYVSNIILDGDYIYYQNLYHYLLSNEEYDKECRVYDLDGNLVDTIDMDGNCTYSDDILGVYNDKLIIAWANEENPLANYYYTLDKSQIGTGVHKVEKMIIAPVRGN
ncbi:MAG: hypothetical protein K0S76_2319 [Herbinix sp.]|nr:hypothetical protein [Herbinix sp.]